MIRVGIIGLGYWGPNLARSLQLTGKADIRWLCDTDPERLQLIREKYPQARATQRAEDVFADGETDAVVVATTVSTHFQLAEQALRANKHLLVEKPLTADPALARQLIQIAADAGRTLMVGHVFEYNPAIRALKALIDRGELGEVHYLCFERTNLGPVRTDVNVLWDLATHDVSIMCYLMGSPLDVSARGQIILNAGVEDAAFATFGLTGNRLAHMHVSWLSPRKVRQIVVVGSQKMAVFDDLDLRSPLRVFDKRVEIPQGIIADSFLMHKTLVVDGGCYVPPVEMMPPLQLECEHFLDAIAAGQPVQSDGVSGLRVVLALTAAIESLRNGSAVVPIAPADAR